MYIHQVREKGIRSRGAPFPEAAAPDREACLLPATSTPACTGHTASAPAGSGWALWPQRGHRDPGTPLTGPLCIRAISVGWYTLVSSCPLYPLYGDTGLLAAKRQESGLGAGLSGRASQGARAGKRVFACPGITSNPEEAWPGVAKLGGGCRCGGPSRDQHAFVRSQEEHDPGLSCSVRTLPPFRQRKMLLSATFISPSALRGQRPRGAHGPSAAVQDGQAPALASTTAGQLPGARVSREETPQPETPHAVPGHSWLLILQDPATQSPTRRTECTYILSCGTLASFQNYFQLQEYLPMPSGVLVC